MNRNTVMMPKGCTKCSQ